MNKKEYKECFDMLSAMFPESNVTFFEHTKILYLDIETKKAIVKITLCDAYFIINKIQEGYQRVICETSSKDERNLANAKIFISLFCEECQKKN